MVATQRAAAFSADARPASGLREAAERLWAVWSDGAKRLRFSIKRGCARRDASTRKRIRESYTDEWHAAQDCHPDGTITNRLANVGVLEQHLLGTYDIAIESPSWASYFALDIDLPAAERPDDLESILRAQGRRDAVLADVWRAFGLGTGRLPVILGSPGGGYHLYFPLARVSGRRLG